MSKIAIQGILDEYGGDDIMAVTEANGWAWDSVVPGACRRCGFVLDSVEPDARNYSCEEGCGRTVDSVMVLLGVL